MKTGFIVAIIIGVLIFGSATYVYSQMYDCLNPPLWMKIPRFGFEKCFQLFIDGNLPDWTQAKQDYESKQALKNQLIERFKDKPEVIAFYSIYEDAKISVRDDHISYFSGSEDDYFARMNLVFDENYNVTNIDFHCYFQRTHQYEFPQEDIVNNISKFNCKEYRNPIIAKQDSTPEPDPTPEPEIIKETSFDSDKYYEEFGTGSPLIYKQTSKPVLNYENCDRYAYWLTEHQKEKIDRYEDYPRYPPWGNQIFPLVEFCTSNGDFVKLAAGDKIQWSFYKIYSEDKPDPESFRDSEASTKIEISFGEPYQNGLVPVTISEVTIFAEELDEITIWNFGLIGYSGDDRYISWDTLPKKDRIGYQILNDNSEDAIDHSRMPQNWAIPADQHIYELDCGLFNTIEGESAHPTTFPIEKGNYAIIAKNSRMGIFPDSIGEYSFEFASIFPHYVRFFEDSGVEFSSDTKQCSSSWQIDSESGIEHGDGYYTSMTFRFE